MKITLTKEESEEFFLTALCNGVGTGYISGHGLNVDTDKAHYQSAKEKLLEKTDGKAVCYEDVLMQVLRDGNPLIVTDDEGGEDSEYNVKVTLDMVHERVQTAPLQVLVNVHNEEDDADDADAILQTVFFNEIIFG